MSEVHSFHSFPELLPESRNQFWQAFLSLVPRNVLDTLTQQQVRFLLLNDDDELWEPYYLWREIPGMGKYEAWWGSENGISIMQSIINWRFQEVFQSFSWVMEVWVGKNTPWAWKSSGVLIKAFQPAREKRLGSIHIGDAEDWKTYWF